MRVVKNDLDHENKCNILRSHIGLTHLAQLVLLYLFAFNCLRRGITLKTAANELLYRFCDLAYGKGTVLIRLIFLSTAGRHG